MLGSTLYEYLYKSTFWYIEKRNFFLGPLVIFFIWFFTSHQQYFSYKGTGIPGLNQY